MPLAVGGDRLEAGHLVLRLQDRLVGVVQILEVAGEGAKALLDRERLQHVVTDEVGQVADRLHRDRLVKQVERLKVGDAEPPPEGVAVGGERVTDLRLRDGAQPPSQIVDLAAGHHEVLGD